MRKKICASGFWPGGFPLFIIFLKQAPLSSAALADSRKAPRSALLLSQSHGLDAMTTNVFIAEVHLPKKTSKQNTKSLVKGEMSSLHSKPNLHYISYEVEKGFKEMLYCRF